LIRKTAFLIVVLLLGCNPAWADDGLGLKRGGNAREVSVSGVSAGAAMAVQYAVAHSGSVVGVGAIAGPGWGCAEGRVAEAINNCMCGRQAVNSKIDIARSLAASTEEGIDRLISGKPQALKRSYVFHSAGDHTVAEQPGQAGIDFLASFIGSTPVVDRGNPQDGSNEAGHGIVSPDGGDSCRATARKPPMSADAGRRITLENCFSPFTDKVRPTMPASA
jgi:poly(3-hydroxybutyrate) depolymerase